MKQNGSNLRVYRNGTLIAYERDFTFTIDNNLPDASNKDSGGFAEHIRGQKSATLDFTALVDLTADYGMPEALNELIDRGEITVSWQLVDGATEFYAGRASYSTISSDASNEDVVLWSGSLTINGDFGIYPVSLTRTLRTDNDRMSFSASNIFGFDSDSSFYYVDNTTKTPWRLKNGIETNLGSALTTTDFIGVTNDRGSAYIPFPSNSSPNVYKIKNGVKSTLDLYPNDDLYNVHIEDGFAYCVGLISSTLQITKENVSTGAVIWTHDTTLDLTDYDTFQIIKQGSHIVMSYTDLTTGAWSLYVVNESTGAFIRTVAVVTDADTIGVWMAVLGTTLYLGYGDGALAYYKKLTFNNTTLIGIISVSTTNEICPVRVFDNKIYFKIGGGLYIYNSSDVEAGTSQINMANVVDFTINNGVLIAYQSSDTTIKCFAV